MVVLRFVTEERKFEAILALRLSVTSTSVTAVTGKNGNDFIRKADRKKVVRLTDLDRSRQLSGRVFGGDGGTTIAVDTNEAVG